MSTTINCIKCGDKPTCTGGHVHRGDKKIIARFCSKCFHNVPQIEGCKGCYGEWTESMGEDKRFMELCYIDKDGIHPVE